MQILAHRPESAPMRRLSAGPAPPRRTFAYKSPDFSAPIPPFVSQQFVEDDQQGKRLTAVRPVSAQQVLQTYAKSFAQRRKSSGILTQFEDSLSEQRPRQQYTPAIRQNASRSAIDEYRNELFLNQRMRHVDRVVKKHVAESLVLEQLSVRALAKAPDSTARKASRKIPQTEADEKAKLRALFALPSVYELRMGAK